jgi:hypothetical protein
MLKSRLLTRIIPMVQDRSIIWPDSDTPPEPFSDQNEREKLIFAAREEWVRIEEEREEVCSDADE